MPKKPTKKDREFVLGFLDDMNWLFAIQNYEKQVDFCEDPDGESFADISILDDYQRVVINIYPKFWEQKEREYQMKILLHELIHTWIDPLDRIVGSLRAGRLETEEHARHSLERTVCNVEHVLHALLMGKKKFATEAYKKWLKERPN